MCLEPSSQRRLVVGCGPVVLIVNAASGEIEGTYAEYHSDDVFSVAWGKDAADKVKFQLNLEKIVNKEFLKIYFRISLQLVEKIRRLLFGILKMKN